ncbi:hypothetical protein GGS23DRAFT_408214 [Durotheca rogersii]|uniref:uncharacterized protein n=1 Tax=Durotheca rogersii TaxID=419775 RepID=UPI0022204BAF|nr:uncharacterized protein GGS23DRAFT_408214 [Durotheca rogersii]KAI5865091.1 hypothetical protein GGS23DRAFT_408214 [Durotheca rogersii]
MPYSVLFIVFVILPVIPSILQLYSSSSCIQYLCSHTCPSSARRGFLFNTVPSFGGSNRGYDDSSAIDSSLTNKLPSPCLT